MLQYEFCVAVNSLLTAQAQTVANKQVEKGGMEKIEYHRGSTNVKKHHMDGAAAGQHALDAQRRPSIASSTGSAAAAAAKALMAKNPNAIKYRVCEVGFSGSQTRQERSIDVFFTLVVESGMMLS